MNPSIVYFLDGKGQCITRQVAGPENAETLNKLARAFEKDNKLTEGRVECKYLRDIVAAIQAEKKSKL